MVLKIEQTREFKDAMCMLMLVSWKILVQLKLTTILSMWEKILQSFKLICKSSKETSLCVNGWKETVKVDKSSHFPGNI